MARLEPTWMYLRRLYDLPVLSVAGTLSITSINYIYASQVSSLIYRSNAGLIGQITLSICIPIYPLY
ncbi:hypothetical protein A1122_17865 [Yersinia pestis A1122]|nr:hypothetical protein A1122_17865 [Yersinia pestis A1122]